MKKLTLLFVSILFGTILIFGQGQSPESLTKSAKKSDADIQDPKKSEKSSTWEKRGDLFLEMAQYNTKGLYIGMPQPIIEQMKGKANTIKADGTNEDWFYDGVILHFANKLLASWEETIPIDPEALNKAFEAYIKADQLDPKGKFKTRLEVKVSIYNLRGLYTTAALEHVNKKEYEKAVKNFEKALILAEFPKTEADTSFDIGLITYYTGVFAYTGKDFTTAEKYFLKCIENKWQGGLPYSSLSSVYKETKDKEKEYAILQKGFELYPESKELLIGFIFFYLNSGQSDKAMEKIEFAIKDDPKNPNFIFAKAALFDNMIKDSLGKFTVAEKMDFFAKAIEGYNKVLEIEPNFFDANFNLGALFFNSALDMYKEADSYGIRQVKEFEAKVEQAKAELAKSLPYMEKAHEIDPSDRVTIQTLSTIYHRMQKYDKVKIMDEKLSKLPAKPKGGL
jgi:tetratricopeptide (TPR) repeat protein